MKSKVAFIGAGSHSDAVLPMLNPIEYDFIGYFDDKQIDRRDGFPVLGKIQDAERFLDEGLVDFVFITIGDNLKRKEIFNYIAKKHYRAIMNIISKDATILTPESIKGQGIFLGHGSFIGSKVELKDNSIINTGSVVEHHTIVNEHCNISPNATVNGFCHLKEGTYVGSGSVIIQTIKVAKFTTIGAGAVVVKNIEKSGTYVGIPAKKIK